VETRLIARGILTEAEAARLLGAACSHRSMVVLAHDPGIVALQVGSVKVEISVTRREPVAARPARPARHAGTYRVVVEARGDDPRECLVSLLARAGLPASRFEIRGSSSPSP
jgi:hypothetical protein